MSGVTAESRPREVGPVFWFALAAAVLTVVLRVSGVGVLAFVTLVLALYWAVVGVIRLRRIHEYVQARRP